MGLGRVVSDQTLSCILKLALGTRQVTSLLKLSLPLSLFSVGFQFPLQAPFSMSRHPEVLWAQRSDKVYLTISLPDATDISIKCEPVGLFSFSAMGVQGESFDFSLDLFGRIVPEGCKTNVGLRNIICSVQKEEKGWWMRLLKTEEKPAPYIKVDWNKWCDEDEEEPTSDLASDDDDARYVGRDDESSDDEGLLYLPDLEKARGN